MFTGIIQAQGTVTAINRVGGDAQLSITSEGLPFASYVVGESIAVNGVCLTVVDLQAKGFSVDVSVETLSCTTFSDLAAGDQLNLEKALQLSSRLSGHMVSGHVDGKGMIENKHADARSERFEIKFPAELAKYICKKGSICIDGVSLTINDVRESTLSVNIIPHTLQETIFSEYTEGRQVNLEVDIVARYMESLMADKD
jgi:riboflavin synthase